MVRGRNGATPPPQIYSLTGVFGALVLLVATIGVLGAVCAR
jgi:hypothetical protein